MSKHQRRSRRRSGAGEPEQVLYLGRSTAAGQTVFLSGGEADHARRSLRVRSEDPVVLVDGRGSRYRGRVVGMTKSELEVRVQSVEPVPRWPREDLWLGAGVLRSTRMDTLIEKASELGVTRLIPLLLRRSVARPHEAGAKQERWHRLAVESLKQSQRSHIMEVADPRPLEDFLEEVPGEAGFWMADPAGRAPQEAARAPRGSGGPLVLVVGPEGGLSPEEGRYLGDRGAVGVRLGGNRLRAETAALALVTAALAYRGELDPPAD